MRGSGGNLGLRWATGSRGSGFRFGGVSRFINPANPERASRSWSPKTLQGFRDLGFGVWGLGFRVWGLGFGGLDLRTTPRRGLQRRVERTNFPAAGICLVGARSRLAK